MKYPVDSSALIRIIRGQVDQRWDDLVERGMLAVCEPVLVESLAVADTKRYHETEAELRATYPWVPVPDDVWTIVDHLIAATAIRLKLVVLHEDADFETAARLVQQLEQQRLSRQVSP